MILPDILSKYAFSKASDWGGSKLRKYWNEVFPPTPLYIAALEAAIKEVRDFLIEKEHVPPENVPDLDVREALAGVDWKELDSRKVSGLPPVTKDVIQNTLQKYIGSHDTEGFVRRVLEVADTKFKKAITLQRDAAPLWKEYVVQIAESQNRTQEEILQELSSIREVLSVWLTVDKTSQPPCILTLDEMLGTDSTSVASAIVSRPSGSSQGGDLATIGRVEFWDRFNKAKDKWWDARFGKLTQNNTIRRLENKAELQGGLSDRDKAELEDAQSRENKHTQEMEKAKAMILTLAMQAEELFE